MAASQHATDGGNDTKQFDGRIGPKMKAAVKLTNWKGAYPSMNALAVQVGPNGSQDYGYRIVHRCMNRGLLTIDKSHPDATPQGQGAVVLTEKGREYASHLETKE